MGDTIFLMLTFFIISLVYSSIGFGGGSSYLAVMALCAVPLYLMPRFALACNIIVVLGGCWVYYRSKHLDIKRALPFILGSIPLSFIGGMIPVNRTVFLTLLAITLIAASLNMIFFSSSGRKKLKEDFFKRRTGADAAGPRITGWYRCSMDLAIGGCLGFVSGLVGIGGGIFLAPLLHAVRWGYAKQIAATASLFILLNSIAGLAGQLSKGGVDAAHLGVVPLALAVLAGGQVGSRLGAFRLSELFVKNATAGMVMFAGLRIMFKVYL